MRLSKVRFLIMNFYLFQSSGYCWCANEITGEPISSTSVYNSRPDCSNSQQQQQQQPQHQPWIKCPENKKKIFQVGHIQFNRQPWLSALITIKRLWVHILSGSGLWNIASLEMSIAKVKLQRFSEKLYLKLSCLGVKLLGNAPWMGKKLA